MSIFTGSDIDQDRNLSCDVCIVGSGAGGAVVADRLATAGKRVIVLEEGGYYQSPRFNMLERDMFPLLYQEHSFRATSDLSIAIAQGRAIGGTTVVNWTTCFRTPKQVLEHWAEHHGVEGITEEALIPHWEEIEKRLSIDQVGREEVNRNNEILLQGAEKLGWHWTLLKRNVDICAHLGYCGMGCPIDAKQSMLLTFVPDASSKGADFYANASVRIVDAAGRKATRVHAQVLDPVTEKPTGKWIRVTAKHIVLSGGGINNPALLLRSRIGNNNNRVGKRTFLHPAIGMFGFFPEPVESFKGAPQTVACLEFDDRGSDKTGYFIETAPAFPMFAASFMTPIAGELQGIMDRLGSLNTIGAALRDGFDTGDFDEGGSVTLKENGAPKVDYKWTPRLMEAFADGARNVARIQLTAGAIECVSGHVPVPVKVRTEADLKKLDAADWGPVKHRVFCAHVMGGCAMGKDPAKYVVNSEFRHHDFENLHVIDGSVFPTSLGVNPQLTIYGLASYASEILKQKIG